MIFSSFLRQKPKRDLQFAEIAPQLKDNQAFALFCQNFVIKKDVQQSGSSIVRIYKKVAINIEKAINKEKINVVKMIRPLKDLCLRLFQQKQGITTIHLIFLQLCLAQGFPRQAVQITKTKALPKRISKCQYSQFCRIAGNIYLKLEQYENAFKMLKNSIMSNPHDLQKTVNTIKKYILLSKIVGEDVTFEHLNNMFEHLNINTDSFQEFEKQYEDQDTIQNKKAYKYDPQQMDPYKQLLDNISLSTKQLGKIKADGNLFLYEKILTKQQSYLRDTLKKDIIKNSARIRMNEIKQIPINNWQNIRKVNCLQGKRLFKYDCKQQIAIFTQFQNRASSDLINSTVTECMQKYQEFVNNAPAKKQHKQSAGGAKTGGISSLMGRFMSK